MKVTVDRIEEGIAVLLIRPEEDYEIQLPIKYLPQEVKEGSILNINMEIDEQETEKARERVSSLINKLRNKNKKK